MPISNLLFSNRVFLEVIYSFIISSICLVIAYKSDRYFKLSLHSGLRYFRNAFLFYGLAFFWKFSFAELTGLNTFNEFFSQFVFEYLLILGGAFLLYSLLWKKFSKQAGFSSLISSKLLVIYLIALILTTADCVLRIYFLLFISQILIFLIASLLVFKANKEKGNKSGFLKIYGFAIILGLIAWLLNFGTAFLFGWNLLLMIDVGVLNVIFFLLVLFGIMKITKTKTKI